LEDVGSSKHSENAEEQSPPPINKKTLLLPGESLVEGLKRALHLCDKDLLKEVLKTDKKLAKHKLDAANNV
jgi:hypothetical protein